MLDKMGQAEEITKIYTKLKEYKRKITCLEKTNIEYYSNVYDLLDVIKFTQQDIQIILKAYKNEVEELEQQLYIAISNIENKKKGVEQ